MNYASLWGNWTEGHSLLNSLVEYLKPKSVVAFNDLEKKKFYLALPLISLIDEVTKNKIYINNMIPKEHEQQFHTCIEKILIARAQEFWQALATFAEDDNNSPEKLARINNFLIEAENQRRRICADDELWKLAKTAFGLDGENRNTKLN